MASFEPRNPGYAARVAESFASQAIMATMGITLESVTPGEVILAMPFDARLTQQDGFLHAGAVTTALDSACGYAAFSLMPVDARVLTIEFKSSLMAPAVADAFVFRGRVLRSGRTLMFTEGDAFAVSNGAEKRIAAMTATMMIVMNRDGQGARC